MRAQGIASSDAFHWSELWYPSARRALPSLQRNSGGLLEWSLVYYWSLVWLMPVLPIYWVWLKGQLFTVFRDFFMMMPTVVLATSFNLAIYCILPCICASTQFCIGRLLIDPLGTFFNFCRTAQNTVARDWTGISLRRTKIIPLTAQLWLFTSTGPRTSVQ